MRNNKPSIDGFISRPSGRSIGSSSKSSVSIGESKPGRDINQQSFDQNAIRRPLSVPRSEIDESLRDIDEPDEGKKRRRRKQRNKKPVGSRRKLAKRVLIVIAIIILGIVGYVGLKTMLASGNIFKGNPFDILLQNAPLKTDGNGRSNILILGTSEDDPGHGGAYLTDSMMILSIDQNKKNAYMFSIPRDLYVQYGMACNSGYQGKINEFFNCVNDDYTQDSAEDERMTKTRSFVGGIFGLDVQYGVHVNNTVIKDAVNAVGGINVDIQGSGGEPGILDRNFDWRCKYNCYFVKYDNGIHHLDGEHALYLAMARGDVAPTYGLGNSNFDREKNQQKIIVALKDKAASTGTLTDIGKVTSLIDAFGKNLRTNIQTKEVRTLMGLGNDIKSSDIHQISLFDDNAHMVTSDNIGGASVVVPSAGAFDYSQIQTFIDKQLNANDVTREAAHLIVLNGSGVSGVGQTEADKLEKQGFTISDIDNAPEDAYADVEIYQVGSGKTASAAKLKQLFNVKTIKTTTPPVTVFGDTNFVIIFGKSRSSNN